MKPRKLTPEVAAARRYAERRAVEIGMAHSPITISAISETFLAGVRWERRRAAKLLEDVAQEAHAAGRVYACSGEALLPAEIRACVSAMARKKAAERGRKR